MKNDVRNKLVGIVKKGGRKTVKPVIFMDIIRKFESNEFNKQQKAYDLATKEYISSGGKGKLAKEKYFDAFTIHMVKDGALKTKNDVTGWGNNNWDISGFYHADIDIKPDEWTDELFNSIWKKLESTSPALMHPSANKGIKCYWFSDINNTLENRRHFQGIAQFIIKDITTKLGIEEYYDHSPTDPTRQSYGAGTVINGKSYFYSDLENSKSISTKKAIHFVKSFHKNLNELEDKRTALLKNNTTETGFNGLDEAHQKRIKNKADNALNKYNIESKNTGGMTVWKFIGALVGYGLDYQHVVSYVADFHRMKGKPQNWSVNKKVTDYYKTYSCDIDGVVQKLNNENIPLRFELKKIESRISKCKELYDKHTKNTGETTSVDNNDPIKKNPNKSLKLNFANSNNYTKSGIVEKIQYDFTNTLTLQDRVNNGEAPKIRTIGGVVGGGKTTQSMGLIKKAVYDHDYVVVQVVNNRKKMFKTNSESLYNEQTSYFKDEKVVSPEIFTVYSNTGVLEKSNFGGDATVINKLDNFVEKVNSERHGSLLMITSDAFKKYDFSKIKRNKIAILDDVTYELGDFRLDSGSGMESSSLTKLMRNFVFIDESDNSHIDVFNKRKVSYEHDGVKHYVISGLSINAVKYIESVKNKNDGFVDSLENTLNLIGEDLKCKGMDYHIVLVPMKEFPSRYQVYYVSTLSANSFMPFNETFMLADDVKNNPLISYMRNHYNLETIDQMLKYPYKNVNRRFTLEYLTDGKFKKGITEANPLIQKMIAKAVGKKHGTKATGNKTIYFAGNKSFIEAGHVKHELDKWFDNVISGDFDTRGRNDLKHVDVILEMYICNNDINRNRKNAIFAISADDQKKYEQFNYTMQNTYRGILRDRNSTGNFTLITMEQGACDYINERHKEYSLSFGANLLSDEVNNIYNQNARGGLGNVVSIEEVRKLTSTEMKWLENTSKSFGLSSEYAFDIYAIRDSVGLPKLQELWGDIKELPRKKGNKSVKVRKIELLESLSQKLQKVA